MENKEDNQTLIETPAEVDSAEVDSAEVDSAEVDPAEVDSAEKDPAKETPEKKHRPTSGHDLLFGFALGFITVGILSLMFFWYMKNGTKEAVIGKMIDSEALTSATSEEIEDGKYKGMIAALDDSYAAYYNAQETESNQKKQSGVYSGIGIGAYKDTDTGAMGVAYVISGSAAETAGLEAKDLITEIDGVSTADQSLEDLSAQISGKNGREITLTVLRGTDELTVKVTPGEIVLPEVSHEMKDGNIGYLRITGFVKTTAEQFDEALKDLQSQGMTRLIIDLRDNPGGLVDAATGCLDDILPEGLEVYIVEKDGKRTDYNSDGKSPLTIPVVLLVNGSTASAAEIFAGACRDRLGATLVGEKTFGKGIVQTTTTLSDGSSVKFTTAQYYTPNGDAINGKGFVPDTEVALGEGAIADASEEDAQYMKAAEIIAAMN